MNEQPPPPVRRTRARILLTVVAALSAALLLFVVCAPAFTFFATAGVPIVCDPGPAFPAENSRIYC